MYDGTLYCIFILFFSKNWSGNEACWMYNLQSATERHQNSSGTKEVQRGWTNRSFKSPFLRADESAAQSCTERYLGSLGSCHWLEWGHIMHLWGTSLARQMWHAHVTLMSHVDRFGGSWLGESLRGQRKNISSLQSFSFISSLLGWAKLLFGGALWGRKIDKLMSSICIN